MSELRDRIASLTPEQRRRLEERLRGGAPSPIASGEGHRLSFGQERLWALSQRMGDSAVYNIHTTYRIRGPLDLSRLTSSFDRVMRQNGELRVSFSPDTGEPRPLLSTAVHLPTTPSETREDALVEVEDWINRPFNLAEGPLIAARVWRLAPEDHILSIRVHHLVCDGWSLRLIEEQLSAAYAGEAIEASPHRYSEFVEWERRNEPMLRERMETWAPVVADAEPLRLPGERAGSGGEVRFDLGADASALIDAVATRLRATPFRVLLAAFAVALNRHTGQTDIVVCTPVAGRPEPAFEGIVGYFNDIVPIRVRLDGDPSLSTIVDRLEQGWLASIEAPVPFQWIATAAGETALTRGLFALNVPREALRLQGLAVEPVSITGRTSDFGMDWLMRKEAGSYRGVVRHRATSDVPYAALVDTFSTVVAAFAEDAGTALSWFPPMAGQPTEETAETTTSRPTSAVEARLHAVWERIFRRSLSIHDDFFDLGGHSLLAAELIAEVEKEFELEPLPLSTLFEAPTVSGFARLLDGVGEGRRWESLVPIKPTGDRPPLFFVHAHGGNVIGYSDLARHLSEDQPLYGLQAPRNDGEVTVRRLEDIAAAYVEEIKTVQPHGPYVVGGWCLGGDVAFEMGRRLRADGEEVALVIMVDNPRPGSRTAVGTPRVRRILDRVLTRLDMEWSNLVEVPSSERPRFVVDRTRRLVDRALGALERAATRSDGSLPFGIAHGRGYHQDQIAAAHSKAYETYAPGAYEGAVAVFRAELRPRGGPDDPTLGWSPHLRGPVFDYRLPGYRIGMLSEPRIERSAPIIEGAIARALGS